MGFLTENKNRHVIVKCDCEGAEFEIEILGEMRPATLITEPLFDPQGERMRG